MNANSVTMLLLADASACLRSRVLRELLSVDESDDEYLQVKALRTSDPVAAGLIASQNSDGSWRRADGAWRGTPGAVMMTSYALHRLGMLGFDDSLPAVRRGAEYLFQKQRKDGGWPLADTASDEGEEGLSMCPLQTALPLRGLTSCGYAQDQRSEHAFQWLMKYRLDDGAWPTGYAKDNLRGVAGYRRIAHSQWGCRSNTTGVLQCLVHHAEFHDEAARALDLLLGRETRDAHAFGFETARMLGAEAVQGLLTFYARFDVGLLLDLAARVGASKHDARVADLVSFVESLRGPYGMWEYTPRPQCSRWLTFLTLQSLRKLDQDTDWVSFEPRTPFKPYPVRPKRF
jgi:hypothetical protein